MKRSALFSSFCGIVLTVTGITGCVSSNRRGEPFTRAVDISRPRLGRGEQVFYQRCNVCHPGGSAGFGPSLNAESLPAWYFKLRVRGLGAGHDFAENRLSSQDLDAVTLYLQAKNF